MIALVMAASFTFLALAMAAKIVPGKETLVYYQHEIAVMITATFLWRMLRQPVLCYLDVTILGVGLFLAFGRVGCLMVGCCHGRPSPWGVCYARFSSMARGGARRACGHHDRGCFAQAPPKNANAPSATSKTHQRNRRGSTNRLKSLVE